ncbi:MAG: thermonuclease family protein [Planctomycetes bacterium]|nr:thermonuclease family protein [Planctomycetota bacterium]
MRRWITHALACAAGVAGTFLLQFLYAQGAPKSEAQGPRRVELSVADGGIYRVRKVVDGDTVELENGLHVRYLGVNAPETGRWLKEAAPLGEEAAARNRALVEQKAVRIHLGPEPLDPYGRLVARLTVVADANADTAQAKPADELNVETTLLKEGLAKVLGLGLSPAERAAYQKIEEQAKEAKAGLWGLARAPEKEAAFPFCASSAGEVFHRAECAQAKRISAAHYVGFRSEEDARASGRRPCSQCMKASAP